MAQGQYVVFYQGSRRAKDIVVGDPANAGIGDIWVPFAATNGDTCVQNYDYDANHNLVYSPPPAPPAAASPAQLFSSIQNDATLTAAQKGVLAQYFGTLCMMVGNSVAIKAVWQQIIAAYGPAGSFGTWLTAPLQTLIVNYAAAANIQLV